MRTSKIPLIAVMILIATMGTVAGEDAPAMWMVQTDDGVDLMINTSNESMGVNAWINFDPECINITDIEVVGPWTALADEGWSNQGNYTPIVLTNFDGVPAGEYTVAEIEIELIDENCTETVLTITNAEPEGTIVYDLVYNITEEPEPPVPPVPEDAVISIGDGTGIVTLPIEISNADNVGSVDVTLSFDPTVVNVTGIETGDFDCTYVNDENVAEGWIRVGAIQGNNPGIDDNATILYVSLAPVGEGATCNLTIEVTTYKEDSPAGTPMDYTIENGIYTASINGDVNGDGVVDVADASYLGNHIVGIDGYEYIDEVAADVDGSGNVDMADVAYLMNHVIGEVEYAELL